MKQSLKVGEKLLEFENIVAAIRRIGGTSPKHLKTPWDPSISTLFKAPAVAFFRSAPAQSRN
jgi:hypothetical protein